MNAIGPFLVGCIIGLALLQVFDLIVHLIREIRNNGKER